LLGGDLAELRVGPTVYMLGFGRFVGLVSCDGISGLLLVSAEAWNTKHRMCCWELKIHLDRNMARVESEGRNNHTARSRDTAALSTRSPENHWDLAISIPPFDHGQPPTTTYLSRSCCANGNQVVWSRHPRLYLRVQGVRISLIVVIS
jgi:hypothetical protein